MSAAERAQALFREGYNCAQSVLLPFDGETGLEFQTAGRLASSFGGGMGKLREVCGALTAAFMAAGLLYGYDDPKDMEAKTAHYRLVQSLARQFKEKSGGTLLCRELLGLNETDGYIPAQRTEKYYAERPCERLVGEAAAMIETLLERRQKVMKIAVASEGAQVSGHFGHCEGFTLYDVQDGKVAGKKVIPNPGHRPGFLPVFLHEQGATVILAGGMGQGARDLFKQNATEVITGVTGEADDAVARYLSGELRPGDEPCHEHAHHGECGGSCGGH